MDWWHAQHKTACMLYFMKVWFGMVLAVIGPISDIINIVNYFNSDDIYWGAASLGFVVIGWTAQWLLTLAKIKTWLQLEELTDRTYMSAFLCWLEDALKKYFHISMAPCIAVLNLTTVFLYIDKWLKAVEVLQEEGPQGVQEHGETPDPHAAYLSLLAAVFENGPNLILTIYIVLNNQLDQYFLFFQFQGLAFAWQMFSLVKGIVIVSLSLNKFVALLKDGMKKYVILALGSFDASTHVLNIALFAAGLRGFVFVLLSVQFLLKLLLYKAVTAGTNATLAGIGIAVIVSQFSTTGAFHLALKPGYASEKSCFQSTLRVLALLVEAFVLPVLTYLFAIFSANYVPESIKEQGLFRNVICSGLQRFNCMPESFVWAYLGCIIVAGVRALRWL
jgi:hypothetical protein